MHTRQKIPAAVILISAETTSKYETYVSPNGLFCYAGAFGDQPEGSKLTKAQAWLGLADRDATSNPLAVAGKIIEPFMEGILHRSDSSDFLRLEHRHRIKQTLTQNDFRYARGRRIIGAVGTPSRTLEEFIRHRESRVAIDRSSKSLTEPVRLSRLILVELYRLRAIVRSRSARSPSPRKVSKCHSNSI